MNVQCALSLQSVFAGFNNILNGPTQRVSVSLVGRPPTGWWRWFAGVVYAFYGVHVGALCWLHVSHVYIRVYLLRVYNHIITFRLYVRGTCEYQCYITFLL